MKSIKNIKRIYNNEIYVSISIDTAIKLQEKGINLKQFKNLKSMFVKEKDLLKVGVQNGYIRNNQISIFKI